MQLRPDLDQAGWMVCECIFRLVATRGVAIDHRLLAIVAPDRRVAAQINGLASLWDAAQGQWRSVPIGYSNQHRLRVWLTGAWHWQKGVVTWVGEAEKGASFLPILGTDGTLHTDLTTALQGGLVDVAAGLNGALTGHDMTHLLIKAMAKAKQWGSGDRTDPSARGLAYPALGLGANSNSVASSLRVAMGLKPAPSGFGGWAPGYGTRL